MFRRDSPWSMAIGGGPRRERFPVFALFGHNGPVRATSDRIRRELEKEPPEPLRLSEADSPATGMRDALAFNVLPGLKKIRPRDHHKTDRTETVTYFSDFSLCLASVLEIGCG
jgi:hypothetical protein